ncbi:MAG TPA: hypothetical protein VL523_12630, partial [Terriglobia bacterium]|nr:hypothetical protein [Terriglobia bacterium]
AQRADKMWILIQASQDTSQPAKAEGAIGRLNIMVASQIEDARENLARCELEQGELSPAGQATRLLEATHSRAWAWVRQQENFLRSSIEKKVRNLIDLRREAARARPAGPPAHAAPGTGDPGPGTRHTNPAPATDPGPLTAPAAAAPVVGAQPAVACVAGARCIVPPPPRPCAEKNGRNGGTKPLCAFKSAKAGGRNRRRAALRRPQEAPNPASGRPKSGTGRRESAGRGRVMTRTN